MTQTGPAVDRLSSEQSKKSDGERYVKHVANLRRALDVGGDRLDPLLAARARSVLAGADERLALGVDHTIVALAGGTGSGKSSTFNALSRLNFADVGVRRPTTARVTACAWSDAATALLDWLEVDSGRRINRDSALDGDDETSLAGLILLDLPDHDSVESKHREIVDRILPLVDLLIWVVDPQKYADEALHAGYLQSFVGAEASMIVVLNQIDTVAVSARPALVADVGRLLTADGLVGLDVRTMSAKTGEGVGELRETLREAVARRSVAASRLADELDREGRRIADEVPAVVLQSVEPLVDGEVDRAAVVVGVSAVVGEVESTVRFGGPGTQPEFRSPQESAIRVLRSRWVAKVSEGMRPAWADSVNRAVADQDEIAAAMIDALGGVPISIERSGGAERARLLGRVAGAVALVGALVTLAFAIGLVDVALTWTVVAGVVTALAAVTCVGALTIGARMRAALAEQRAEEVRSAAFAALREVVEATMARPVQRVLTAHREVRETALSVRNTSSTGSRGASVPTVTP